MIETVEKKYSGWIPLYLLLQKLKVLGIKKHRFSYTTQLLRSGIGHPKPQGNWIALAIVSLSAEYIEFVPIKQSDEKVEENHFL